MFDFCFKNAEEAKINQKVLGVKRIKFGLDGKPIKKDKDKDKESGIWRGAPEYYPKHELISGHTARRSFCTNHYGKWATADIMYFSGHSSEAMLLQYIKAKPTEKLFSKKPEGLILSAQFP